MEEQSEYKILKEKGQNACVRYTELSDKPFWYRLDKHLPGKGYGKLLMEYWEEDMKKQGHGMLLTSTQVDERAQHFYRKLGYKDCGGLTIDIPGCAQPMELFLSKKI